MSVKRSRNRLTKFEIDNATQDLADGGNLYLKVAASGARKWVFKFPWRGKRKEMTLGTLRPDGTGMQAPAARKARNHAEALLEQGVNPIEDRKAVKAGGQGLTFREWVDATKGEIGPTKPKPAAEFYARMTKQVGALADMRPADITTADVIEALKPVWKTRPPTAKKLRIGIAQVLNAARAGGLITEAYWSNPALYKGILEHLMKKPVHVPTPRPALEDLKQTPVFMATLRKGATMAAYLAEFTILTTVRVDAVRRACWGEFDFKAKTWTIPAVRMKGPAGTERAHVVPLSDAMIAVLKKLSPTLSRPAGALVFPNPSTCRPIRAGTVLNAVQSANAEVTTHGFRSSFMDWGRDQGYPRETLKLCLAQTIGSKIDQSYARDTLLEHRRLIMEAWGAWCSGVALLGERAA